MNQSDVTSTSFGPDDEEKPSKTQLKREMDALQQLGEQLVRLKPDKLRKLPLSERLLDALLECQRLKAHGAVRRQYQLIGKLMRDADQSAIRAAAGDLLTNIRPSGPIRKIKAPGKIPSYRSQIDQEQGSK